MHSMSNESMILGVHEHKIFKGFLGLLVFCTVVSIYFETYLPYLLPAGLIGLGLVYDDYRRLFYLIFAVLPFSVEMYFEGAGLGTDLPSEPIMLILTGITIGTLFTRQFSLKTHYVTHPIFLMIIIHVFWIFVTTINSTFLLISIKLLLAKLWYVLPFFVLPLVMVKKEEELHKTYNILYKILLTSFINVLVRHAF